MKRRDLMRVIAGNRPLDIRSSALRHGIMFKTKDPINGGACHYISDESGPPYIVATTSLHKSLR